jgi:DNA modification methylase
MSLPTPYYQDNACTIYCGDAKEILPQIEAADLILTDPPYGHNNNNGDLIHRWEAALGLDIIATEENSRPIANDGAEANDLVQWFFAESARILRPGSCCCCCGGGGPDPQFARWSLWLDDHLEFKQMVVWDKGPMGMGWHYRRSYEVVLVAQKAGAACKWYDTTSKIENIIRNIPKIIPLAKDHPTPKPQALMQHFIQLHSERGDLVLDPFMGAGTTLAAAKLLGRRAIGIELNVSYCEMAKRRLLQEVLPL